MALAFLFLSWDREYIRNVSKGCIISNSIHSPGDVYLPISFGPMLSTTTKFCENSRMAALWSLSYMWSLKMKDLITVLLTRRGRSPSPSTRPRRKMASVSEILSGLLSFLEVGDMVGHFPIQKIWEDVNVNQSPQICKHFWQTTAEGEGFKTFPQMFW